MEGATGYWTQKSSIAIDKEAPSEGWVILKEWL